MKVYSIHIEDINDRLLRQIINTSDTIFVTRNIFILKNIHFCNVTKLEFI